MEFVVARTFAQKAVGMLAGRGSRPDQCLVLLSCRDVHTCFMTFPLDIAFVSREGRVLQSSVGIKPWKRVRCRNRGAYAVIERRSSHDPWFEDGAEINMFLLGCGDKRRGRCHR